MVISTGKRTPNNHNKVICLDSVSLEPLESENSPAHRLSHLWPLSNSVGSIREEIRTSTPHLGHYKFHDISAFSYRVSKSFPGLPVRHSFLVILLPGRDLFSVQPVTDMVKSGVRQFPGNPVNLFFRRRFRCLPDSRPNVLFL
jgi:hypothetical protein